MKKGYIDLHCHPSLKPFGKSFKTPIPGSNSIDPGKKNSIWHKTRLTFLNRISNRIFTLTKFTQTDLSTVYDSGSRVMIISLYPIERPFVANKLGEGFLSRMLTNLAMGVSQKRIQHVQQLVDYFPDLKLEYAFYKNLDGKIINLNGAQVQFKLARNFQDIKLAKPNTISVIMSVEGGHALGTGINIRNNPSTYEKLEPRIDWLKNLEHKPLFITFAHHFYNELCGHAESLGGIPRWVANQKFGKNEALNPLGEKVIMRLLDKANGKRVLIDIKHMSVLARKGFYQILESQFWANQDYVPIIVSHGAMNGLISFEDKMSNYPDRTQYFRAADINFYDSEIILIAQSKGIFGLQLDERRVVNKKGLKKSKSLFNKSKRKRKKAYLVWRQIEHMAEVLDDAGLACWDIQAIGSDFDGIVDPINEYWTAENINSLKIELLPHAKHYLGSKIFKLPTNKVEGKVILDKVFTDNASKFIETYY